MQRVGDGGGYLPAPPISPHSVASTSRTRFSRGRRCSGKARNGGRSASASAAPLDRCLHPRQQSHQLAIGCLRFEQQIDARSNGSEVRQKRGTAPVGAHRLLQGEGPETCSVSSRSSQPKTPATRCTHRRSPGRRAVDSGSHRAGKLWSGMSGARALVRCAVDSWFRTPPDQQIKARCDVRQGDAVARDVGGGVGATAPARRPSRAARHR